MTRWVEVEVMDKLDLRAPRTIQFRPKIHERLRGFSHGSFTRHVRPTPLYTGKLDLRELGIDAKLYAYCKFGKKGHKLELLNVGDKPYSEIVQTIESVFECNPDDLGVLRVDLAADVENVPVSWFQEHAYFAYKQLGCEYGSGKYEYVGRGEIETIRAGKRPNVIRIYNKIAEWLVQFGAMQKKRSKDSEPLKFEKEFGYRSDSILTRVERQIGGGRVPEELATFGCLIRNAANFDPFSSLRLVDCNSARLPTSAEWPGIEYYTGLGLHAEARRLGMHNFRKELNKVTKGNAGRTLDRYSPFIPNSTGGGLSLEAIRESYHCSVKEQLGS
jgi:hypothetical protein